MIHHDGSGRAPDPHPTTRTVINSPSGVTSAETEDTCTALQVQPDDFRPVPGWPHYEIDPGPPVRVRSTDRVIVDRNGRSVRLKGVERVIVDGAVQLSCMSYRRTLPVSRLVAMVLGCSPCVICHDVVSTQPPPWVCGTCSWSPPVVEPVDLDAAEVTR